MYKVQLNILFYRLFKRLPTIISHKVRRIFFQRDKSLSEKYIEQILSIPITGQSNEYVSITKDSYIRQKNDTKLLAYYLPQFYPFEENDNWWGKGTTEWNNVSRAVPQYVGHYQPRLPGELGFYDLRVIENIKRQVELAKMYGIYGFCYYYYWFDPKRLLDKPLDMLFNDSSIDFPFAICWANESWAKRFWGNDSSIIMEQPNSIESYKKAIFEMMRYFKDQRYIKINGKLLLVIYRPQNIPEPKIVLEYWRDIIKKECNQLLHIVAVRGHMIDKDFLQLGFDATSEFQPISLYSEFKNITGYMPYVTNKFSGTVLDYEDFVLNKKYKTNYGIQTTYRSVMPMWDNTARRDDNGSIFHGSTPQLYQQWLSDIIKESKNKAENIIFINAWNEWGEGAYLEPDRKYGYAYLQATLNAINENRS